MRTWFGPAPATFVLLAQSLELGVPGRESRGGRAFIGLEKGVYGPGIPGELSNYVLGDREALKAAIVHCLEKADRTVKRAHLALEGVLIRNLILPLPYMPPREELRTAVQTEVERYALFAGSEVAFDFTQLGQDLEGLSLLFGAIRRSLIDEVTEVFAECGIEIVSVEPAPLALVRGLMREFPELEDPEGDVELGVLTGLPYELFVSHWRKGNLEHWRSIHAHTETLRMGDPAAVADVQLEVQRTLLEMPAKRWYVVEAPRAVEEVLNRWPDTEVRVSLHRFDESAMRGALDFVAGGAVFGFNLLPARITPKARFSVAQLSGLVAASLILAAGLAVNIMLDRDIRAMRLGASRLQTEANQLALELQGRQNMGTDHELARGAMARTITTATLVSQLRDVTPADTWLTEAQIEPGETLSIQGYALSRTSPLVFAQALNGLPQVANVAIPELRQEGVPGQRRFAFHVTASVRLVAEQKL